MPLISCPECKKEISDQASMCPQCGFPVATIESSVLSGTKDKIDNTSKSDNKSKKTFYTICGISITSILFLLVISLVTYNNLPRPREDASNQAISLGKKIVETTDRYLDGEINASTAKKQIDSYFSQFDDDSEYKGDLFIVTDVLTLSTDFLQLSYDNDSKLYDEVLDARNELAMNIGIKKR